MTKFDTILEQILKGLAKGMSEQDIADKHKVPLQQIQDQLDKGIKVELEHTNDKNVARQIAMDHLSEQPDYYTKLAKIEKKPSEEGFNSL